ncbi:MAG: class II aldolase/adducin family protein [Armatimonadetes bacterium]|nr:class II aldolase/adducin family protein [Armatimonadota bacterium]
MEPEFQLRKLMCEVGRRLYSAGLVVASEGNISARLSGDRILVTPSGVCKGFMAPEQLVITDLDGHLIEGESQPSSEILLHTISYQMRPDVQAVVHAHPPYATAISLTALPFPWMTTPESACVLGPVAQVPFAMPGTQQVSDAMAEVCEHAKSFILSHHGAATYGFDLLSALYRMETLERTAYLIHKANKFGGPIPLPDQIQQQLWDRFGHGRLDN